MYEDQEFEDQIRMIIEGKITINESDLDIEEIDDSSYMREKSVCSCMAMVLSRMIN